MSSPPVTKTTDPLAVMTDLRKRTHEWRERTCPDFMKGRKDGLEIAAKLVEKALGNDRLANRIRNYDN